MLSDNKHLIDEVEHLARILKHWNEQIIIGGGVALVIYDKLLSQAQSGAVGTTDIDYLIPRKPLKAGEQKISKILRNHGYSPRIKSVNQPAVESYFRSIGDVEVEVEFLTDARSRDHQDVVVIKEAGVTAQALTYLEMSLQEGMPLILPSGDLITIVKPEAWVFHKGLTFVKRAREAKKYKDLYGIWFVLSQLGSTSLAANNALQLLMNKNPATWKKTFTSNLNTWMAEATPKDWQNLEIQDIEGRLTKSGFLEVMRAATNS